MQFTVFDTPVIRFALRQAARAGLWAFGWKTEGQPPDAPKYVLIAAPHTSNWDLVVTLCLAFVYRMKVYWLGKDTLFRFPYGFVLRWLGGIPVVRSRSTNMVERSAQVIRDEKEIILIVPPEGTRGKVRWWKTGFYHIAHSAGVPIAMGFIDFARKTGGFGPTFIPSGKIDQDMERIQAFYKNIKGKKQDLWSDDSVALRKKAQVIPLEPEQEKEESIKKAG